MKNNFSNKEWKTRLELAAAYRLIDHFGMAELIYNHISARIPDTEYFLINEFGLRYDEICASNLVKIDAQGCPAPSTKKSSKKRKSSNKKNPKVNPAGFIIHSAIHEARPEVNCIVHTHTIAGMTIAASSQGLQLYSQEALRFHERVAYHDFQGIVLDEMEKASLLESLQDKSVLVLKNHGLLTVGSSVAQAFCLMYYLERACQTQIAVHSAHFKPSEIINLSPSVCKKTTEQHWNKVEQLDTLIWPALLRLLEQKDPSYKK